MKMEEGYRQLKAGDTCLAVDEARVKRGQPWRKLGERDSGVGTDYDESDFIYGLEFRRHITAELDNDLTHLAWELHNWVGSMDFVYKNDIGGGCFVNVNKDVLVNFDKDCYTLAQINEEKARWNLPLIEVEKPDSSEWVPKIGEEIDWLDTTGRRIDCEVTYLSEWVIVLRRSVDVMGEVSDVELAYGWSDGETKQRARPIETPEQKEARERDEWVLNMLHETDGCESFSDSLEIVYDWLKENKKL